ncbi:rod shape-determining protein MreD [Roseomonas sp. KE0001]|uniref:rod shape-determining protein MreD n=1 Tax=Roseomonas sp. KE0001 TaxID=2479201 RepID=UPI0018DF3B99|nr:rod shape-determining protein MreD [Roseomonas sp. KE0001]MBI0433992.1 rod shape-determining protein MreD [Roseomonas sp. KE0001]
MVLSGGRQSPPGLLTRLDALARAACPAAGTALLMVLLSAPTGLPSAVPAVALGCVFFWSLFRPAVMPPPACFALGLLQDLLGFAPLGIGVLTLLLTHGTVLRLRRLLARQPFALVWLAFSGFALAAAGLGWLLTALLGWRLPSPVPALVQGALSLGLYPALAAPLTALHRAMRRAEETAG